MKLQLLVSGAALLSGQQPVLAVEPARELTQFGCLKFEDTQGYKLRGIVGPNLENDWCSYMNMTDSVEDILTTCEVFCGEGRIPVPLAVPTFGINHADMDSICLGSGGGDSSLFGTYDPDIMVRCRQGYTALELIKSRAAEVVKEVDVMRLEQIAFRVKMLKAMKDVSDTVSSEEFTKWLMSYKDSEKIGKYKLRLQGLLQEVLHSGDAKQRLEDAMKAIADSVTRLNMALDEKVPLLTDYANECGRPVLAISSSKEYMMDICNQNTYSCLDDSEAQHVGCCCGSLPATGLFDIPGNTSGRRLNAQDESLGIDVCFEASARAQSDVARLTAELQGSSEGSELLKEYLAALESQYPKYFGCNGRRQLAEGGPGGVAVPERKLQGSALLECSPPTSATVDTSEVMKVAFSKDTERDYCGDLQTANGQKMTTVGLAEQCEEFCGSEAIPLLVGSIDFGFNQSAMDSVCVNSDIVKTDSAMVTQCLENAEAMHAVDIKMSAFVTALTAVEFAKIEYETAVMEKLPAIRDKIEEKAEGVLKGARADQKAAAYSAFLRDEVFSEVTGNSQSALKYKEALARLGQTVESLQTTVRASIQAFTSFLTDCNDLYTGKGLYNEYMLDACSQTSDECIDAEWGRHAGCCCGYTPFMAVGLEKVNYANTIPGITAEALIDGSGSARVAHRLRRLAEDGMRRLSEEKQYYHICGTVWKENDELLTEFFTDLEGERTIFEEWLGAVEARYPDADLCMFGPPTPAPTPAPVPSPTPSPLGPSPSPSGGGSEGKEEKDASGAYGPSAYLPGSSLLVLAAALAATGLGGLGV